MTFSNCSTPTHVRTLWVLSPGDLQPWQRWPSFVPPRTLYEKCLACLPPSDAPNDNRSTKVNENLLDRLIAWLREDWSLDAILQLDRLVYWLRVCAVCEARPLGTLAFIWNLALFSNWAVKPPGFKLDPAFIQIQFLIEEIRYALKNWTGCMGQNFNAVHPITKMYKSVKHM